LSGTFWYECTDLISGQRRNRSQATQRQFGSIRKFMGDLPLASRDTIASHVETAPGDSLHVRIESFFIH